MDKDLQHFIKVDGTVHRDQLRGLLLRCGFDINPQLFDSLDRSCFADKKICPDGVDITFYDSPTLKYEGNTVTGVDDNTASSGVTEFLSTFLADRLMTDIVLHEQHPVTGKAAQDTVFLTCCIDGQYMPAKAVKKAQTGNPDAVHRTARLLFTEELLQTERTQRIPVDRGYRIVDGGRVVFCGGTGADGQSFYKDSAAFRRGNGICYISARAMADYCHDRLSGEYRHAEDYGYTYQTLVTECRLQGFKNPDLAAWRLFDGLSGEGILAPVQQLYDASPKSDHMTPVEQIRDNYDWYLQNRDKAPDFAHVTVRFYNSDDDVDALIALNTVAGSYFAKQVIHTCQGVDSLAALCDRGGAQAAFHITGFTGYSYGGENLERYRAKLYAQDLDYVERGTDWNSDRYVVIHHKDKSSEGFYVKPDGTVYDSTRGHDGKKLADIIGPLHSASVLSMSQNQLYDCTSGRVADRPKVSGVVVRQVGDMPYGKALIRCRIDGQQQSWRDMTLHEYRQVIGAANDNIRARLQTALVNKYFADALRPGGEEQRQQAGGLKR